MTLADFSTPELIIPELRGRDVPSVIQELSSLLQQERRIPELLPFYHAALNREFLVSTEMESGMAFPHARLPGLKELSFAFGRSSEPLAWGNGGLRTVRNVFLIAVPATDSGQYLLLISGLARFARDRALVEKLRSVRDTFEIFELLRQVPLRNGVPVDLKRQTFVQK